MAAHHYYAILNRGTRDDGEPDVWATAASMTEARHACDALRAAFPRFRFRVADDAALHAAQARADRAAERRQGGR